MKFRRGEKGFTLIELMIVVAIIGILAAIAIPQFAAFRVRGFNSTSQSDLRNLATSEEAYFADKQDYCGSTVVLFNTYGFIQSKNVTTTIPVANITSYTIKASHASSDRTWELVGPGGLMTFTGP